MLSNHFEFDNIDFGFWNNYISNEFQDSFGNV